MAMLCIAWEHAAKTDDVKEQPAPCDVGGYVFDIGERMHKVFANAGGHYVEIETSADKHYDSTGLVRIHKSGRNPQIGPSDSLTSGSHPFLPNGPYINAAVGPAWQNAAGKWRRLAEFSGPTVKWSVKPGDVKPDHVQFSVTYTGELDGPSEVREEYVLTPHTLKIKTSVSGTTGPLLFSAPIFANDGEKTASISVKDKQVSVALDSKSSQEFSAPKALKLSVDDQQYPNRNGWSRLAVWEFAAGTPMEIELTPRIQASATANGGN
jgi:hypothetical protein